MCQEYRHLKTYQGSCLGTTGSTSRKPLTRNKVNLRNLISCGGAHGREGYSSHLVCLSVCHALILEITDN